MGRRILIAEDEPNIVISLEFLLNAAGYEVTIARDGAEALALAASLSPDLVVLDVMLPVMNGFELCRRIRGGENTGRAKILMLTARGRREEEKKGLEAGADAYMTKPFATRDLVSKVTELLASPER